MSRGTRVRIGVVRLELGVAMLLSLLLASHAATGEHATEEVELILARGSSGAPDELRVDGSTIGILRREGDAQILEVGTTRVRVARSDEALLSGQPFPRRIVSQASLDRSEPSVRQQYLLLAPPAPIGVEGLGLEVPTDPPEKNAAEHRQLGQWLASQGLPADTEGFERLHEKDAGRSLRVWYEISGRRVDGTLSVGTPPRAEARFDSLFHVSEGGFKIHHARELLYHRESLELVDVLRGPSREGRPMELRSYECGCYGWAIGGDWVTIGGRLYHVKVEWQNHRVGAGFFLGFEGRSGFPWIGFADREAAGLLARRARAYHLTDAKDQPVAEITIDAPSDEPGGAPGPASYDVRVAGPDGAMQLLAHLEVEPSQITARLHRVQGIPGDSALEQIDTLLAAMPTQVLRGDGIRDSHLGEIETMLDWFRLVQHPERDVLADVVSEIDALTAIGKVEALLAVDPARYSPAAEDLPLPPKRDPGSPYPS